MTARAIKKQKQNANRDKPETRKKWGRGERILGGGHLILGRTKGEIAENFGRIQMGDHSNLFGK